MRVRVSCLLGFLLFCGSTLMAQVAKQDTLSLYAPIQKTQAQNAADIAQISPMDLRTPSMLKSGFVYDIKTGNYLYVTTLNGKRIGTPIIYTPAQYRAYLQRRKGLSYYLERDRERAKEMGKQLFNPFDFGFELGPAEKVFGPGGVKLKTQGSAELLFGVKSNATENPSIPANARRHTFFDFDQKIQANMQATVGSKLQFGLNYNTETTFTTDAKKLNLSYEGEEDDIIKLIEAGNVSLNPKNSLIHGGASLFGIHTKMQFGKLDLNFVVSQQEAETKRISSDRGVQTTAYEFSANNYDENRHFYLGHYFRDHYDESLSTLPFIASGIVINRVEVWVTNKRGRFEEARNIVAFSDLGEPQRITAAGVTATQTTAGVPDNRANTLYSTLLAIPSLRQIDQVVQSLQGTFEGGSDYEKLESARRLSPNEYTLNSSLGYLSLHTRLAPDEVLAIAYEYTYQGQVYQVGEFSTDRSEEGSSNLYVKLIKGTSMTPSSPYWHFMMRNVYALGPQVNDLQKERFKLEVLYRNDRLGMAMPYLNEGAARDQLLLQFLGLDKLDVHGEPHPDGVFDYLPGITVIPQRGLIFFNTVEPFGATLRKRLGNDELADKYVYQEIYDATSVEAKRAAEKDKFIIRGEYKASNSGQISLGNGISNVTPGSVRVTAGGATLVENVDYTVNYAMGTVTILNQSILNSGTRVDVSLENKGLLNMQRKTVVGLDANYHFTPDFTLGATVMHLSELPLTTKSAIGSESMRNTLWGTNLTYETEWQALTNLVDKLPFINLTKPSRLKLNAEFAHLIPGHYQGRYAQVYSYIDDFESSQSYIDLLNPYSWMLSSTPYTGAVAPRFPEAALSNNIQYGNRRARIAWYYIDPMFNRLNSTLTPSYIRNNPELQSNHYVREVMMQELFPYRDYGQSFQASLQTLNVAYYPRERGPYNLNAEAMGADGKLVQPAENWGGIMRKVEQSDFEVANIEYLEFWMLDPFIYNPQSKGGSLYINLGEVSEEVLKDEKKFFENGLPINDAPEATESTPWGKVPKRQGSGYAFDNSPGARAKQDVGFNGINSEEEKSWQAYRDYLEALSQKISPDLLAAWREEATSPLNDPAGDDFLHYRNSVWDQRQAAILDRYKYYNGVEGNSAESADSNDPYSAASRSVPDVEDINQDNTLNENESYFEYHIPLTPASLAVGQNYIVDMRPATVTLANGNRETVNWYQVKIPIRDFKQRVGNIKDFKSIRFLRLYLTGFEQELFLRFATFKLVRGDWRLYDRELHSPDVQPITQATLEAGAINIEENGDRQPINYVLPPTVLRSLDPAQGQATQQNEQSLSLKVRQLAPGDARAVYRNTMLDLRRYKRLELFTHAERMIDDATSLSDGDLSIFIRLGSDYRNNYYEYSMPLKLTPYGVYSSDVAADRRIVWPEENKFSIDLREFTRLKSERNLAHSQGAAGVSFTQRYTQPDSKNARNLMAIMGNPSLSNVKTIMIGVRNDAGQVHSAEIWVNELRLGDFVEQGGWAANTDMQLQVSDWGNLAARTTYQSAGFGALDQSLSQRRLEDLQQINLSSNFDMGRFFPEKARVSIPLYYAYNNERISPQYNPQDQDMLLSESLKATTTQAERDSIRRMAITQTSAHALALNNVKVDIRSKTPMPYDPANLSFSYAYSQSEHITPDLLYDTKRDWQASLTYNYTPPAPPLKPFEKLRSKNPKLSSLASYQINYLPSSIMFSTNMVRNYAEQKVHNYIVGIAHVPELPATFVQNFLWDRKMALNWAPTSNVQFSFRSGTNARIEEPHLQVNRVLAPDSYKVWQDSVLQSIAEMGRPMHYDQTSTLSWKVPFALIPYMNWLNGTLNYTGSYNWDLGARLADGSSLGNIIRNDRRIDANLSLSLMQLYKEIPFLAQAEQVVRQGNTSGTTRRLNPPPTRRRTTTQPLRYKQDITLRSDTTLTVKHGLGSKKLKIEATTLEGKKYTLKTRVINEDSFEILSRDTVQLALSVQNSSRTQETQERVHTPSVWGQHLLYSLMLLRDVNVTYSQSGGLNLPGFMPEIAAAGGQARWGDMLAPGLPFAFGLTDNRFVDEAADNGWLTQRTQNINPSSYNQTENLAIRVTLEPLRDLRITLNALRNSSQREETQFVFAAKPRTWSGTFTMTTVGLGGFFQTPKGQEGYASAPFTQFLQNRTTIAEIQQERYAQAGFARDRIQVRENGADVLIPAFLSAYTTHSVSRNGLSPFPSIRALLPNWNVSYAGLGKLPLFKELFRNFSLSHAYTSTYSVNNYTSLLSWSPIVEQDHTLGISKQTDGSLVASMAYEIPAVTLQEAFSPLIGADVTLINGLTFSSKWNRRRTLNLNITSAQLVESSSQEFSIGLGYKDDKFSKRIGLDKLGSSSRSRKGKDPLFTSGGGLTLRADYLYSRSAMLIRKIQEQFTQATNGNISHTLKMSADYAISRMLTLRAFFDWSLNHPLVSSASFPTRNSNFGVALRINLTQ